MPLLATLQRTPLSFVLAIVLCVAVLAVDFALDFHIGPVAPVLFFFGAIVLATWSGGFGAGLVTVVGATLFSGFYFLPSAAGGGFNAPDLARLLLFFAEGTLVAFAATRLREVFEVQRRVARHQTALAQISHVALREGSDLETLFQHAISHTREALGTSHATLLQLEAGEVPYFRLRAQIGWQSLRVGDTIPGDRRTQLGSSALEGTPIPVDNTETDLRFVIPPEIDSEVSACLVAPVGYGWRSWGVLAVHHKTPRAWTKDESDFLAGVANTIGVAIERENARDDILRGEARYRDFLEQSTEAIWRFELEEPIALCTPVENAIPLIFERAYLAECNDAFARQYGYASRDEVRGARLSLFMPDDNPQNLSYLQAAWHSGTRISGVESVEVDIHGQEHIFINSLIGIVEDGALVRIWGTQRDVTQERRAQILISQSEQRFRALFEASPVPIAIIREGIFLFVNPAFIAMIGMQNGVELLGQNVADIIANDFREQILERFEAHEQGKNHTHCSETEFLRPDGARVPVRVETAPLDLPDGNATLAFAFDLTEDRAANAEIAGLLKRERGAALRAQRLQEISVALSQPLSPAQVADLALSRALDALGASAGIIMVPDLSVPDAGGRQLQILAQQGFPDELFNTSRTYSLEEPLHLIYSFRHSEPLWMQDLDLWNERFPVLDWERALTGSRAMAVLPLEVEGIMAGVLSLSFPQTRRFDDDERAFIVTLAGLIAGVLERARLEQNARDAARQQRESLALLHSLLESAPIGFAFFNREGRFVLVNEALAQINGLEITAHIGKTPDELGAPLAREKKPFLDAVWKSGEPSGDVDLIEPGEDGRHCLASFFPVRVEGDEILGVGAVILDISERVRAQSERAVLFDQLEVERARFEAILHQMPSAVILAEAPSGRMILGNPQVKRVMGEEFQPNNILENAAFLSGLTPDGLPLSAHQWPLARAVQSGEVVEGEEIVIPRSGGKSSVVRVNAAPIRDKEGRIAAGVAVLDDVTARARQNASQEFLALAGATLLSTLDEREAFERLAHICVPRIADWCVLAVPGDDGFLHHAAIAHTDAEKGPAAQRFKTQLAHDPQLPWDIAGAMHGNRAVLYPRHSIEHLRKIHASDEYVELIEAIGAKSAIVAPLVARGRVVGVMIWITAESGREYDETDLALADELAKRAATSADNARLLHEAQTARDDAQNANRAKDEFLAVVSHELRTPLTPILGWLDILRSGDLDDKTRAQAYDVIERNAVAQAQLVNDILDVSRITTGKLRLELRPHPLAPLVERAVQSLQPLALDKNIALETEIGEVGLVEADAGRLQQVVWNLLSNALKFTPRGGTIRVLLDRTSGGMARLSIQDSGAGIAPEFLPHVFDRFRQADSSSTRKAGGLGLGLAIVKHIIELHGGSVGAASEGLNRGATFSVLLPPTNLSASTEKDAPSRQTQPVPKPLHNLRVLLVEDEPDTRETLARLLENTGAHVQTASDGAQALQIAPGFSPSLVISDIGMPLMDGYELRARLREVLPRVPALALTAYAAQSDVQKARNAGFEKHLSKPVGADDLVRAIQEILAAPTLK